MNRRIRRRREDSGGDILQPSLVRKCELVSTVAMTVRCHREGLERCHEYMYVAAVTWSAVSKTSSTFVM